MSSQRILITGGCGFIGTNLVESLIRDDVCKIRILDNLSGGKKQYIQAIVEAINSAEEFDPTQLEIHELTGSSSFSNSPSALDIYPRRLQLLVGDIRDPKQTDLACQGMDTVVHLAAHTRVVESLQNPLLDFETNVIGTFNLLESSRKNAVAKFIFASSNAAVGGQNPPINERMIPKPISPYGASKLTGEIMCSTYFHSFGLQTVALRFANAYGSYSDHKATVIAGFLKRLRSGKHLIIYGNGNQTRDFVHARDICRAIRLSMKALDRPTPHKSSILNHDKTTAGEVFQIATERETSILDLARLMLMLFKGPNAKPEEWIVFEDERVGEIRKNFSDITKARKLLNFSPEISLQQGLQELRDKTSPQAMRR